VNVGRQLNATAPGDDDFGGGDGGDVVIGADAGDVNITGPLDVSGSAPDGAGGTIDISAGRDLTVQANVLGGVPGDGGTGGTVTLSALGRAAIGPGARVDVTASEPGKEMDGVFIRADTITVQGQVLADGLRGAHTQLVACTLDVVFGGVVSSTGTGVLPAATNLLQASGAMTISGTLSAGDRNRLEYRDTPPTIGSTAKIDPDEEVVPNPALPCCGDSCPISTTTTTLPSSPTTSTLVPPTTTTVATPTTVAPPTSSTTTTAGTVESTSTSVPPAASTTTPTATLPPTTTSTLPPPSCLDLAATDLDEADCYLDDLSSMLAEQPPAALGGAKTAGTLSTRVAQAKRLLTTARSKPKPGALLLKAKRQLQGFRTLARLRRKKILSELGAQLLTLSKNASDSIDRARKTIRGEASR
jgi:hypothetical protein